MPTSVQMKSRTSPALNVYEALFGANFGPNEKSHSTLAAECVASDSISAVLVPTLAAERRRFKNEYGQIIGVSKVLNVWISIA